MQKRILILIFSFSFGILNAQTKTFHTNGKLQSVGFYNKLKQKTGVWKYYWITGGLHSIVSYKEGFKTDWKHYDNNGKLRESGRYIKGKKNGEWKYYNLEGELNKIGTHKNGQKEGEWKTFYKGELTSLKKYKKSKKDGEWKFFYQDEKLKRLQHWVNGKPDGVEKWFHKKGNLGVIRHYNNGTPIGEHKEYYKSGKIKKIQTFKDGKIIAIKSFYENGFLSATKQLLKNKKIQAKSFYDNGRLGSIAYIENFRGWQPIGTHKHYHQNGKLHYKVKNSYTKRTKTKGYYANGKRKFNGYKIMVEHDGNYNMEATGKWKFYHKTGKLSGVGNFLNGEKVNEWKCYLENGKLDKIEYWVDGKLTTTENK